MIIYRYVSIYLLFVIFYDYYLWLLFNISK